MNKTIKSTDTEVANARREPNNIEPGNSIFGRMINTKKILKAYLKGEITLSELESMGIEVG